jgi:hypothetical protein
MNICHILMLLKVYIDLLKIWPAVGTARTTNTATCVTVNQLVTIPGVNRGSMMDWLATNVRFRMIIIDYSK